MTIWNMKARVLPCDHSSHSIGTKEKRLKTNKSDWASRVSYFTHLCGLPAADLQPLPIASFALRVPICDVSFLFFSFIFEYFKGLIKFCFHGKRRVCVPKKFLPSQNRRHRRRYRYLYCVSLGFLAGSVWPFLSALFRWYTGRIVLGTTWELSGLYRHRGY